MIFIRSNSYRNNKPISMSYNSIRRDRRRMTCLIHARNKYKTLVASDSWNTSSIHNHMIQKIK